MFRNVTLCVLVASFLYASFLSAARATEDRKPPKQASGPEDHNGNVARVIIERVPDYYYARTAALIPVLFRVEGLKGPVTFETLSVTIRFDWTPWVPDPYFSPSGPHAVTQQIGMGVYPSSDSGILRLYPDNDKGFGQKGNGTGTEYIAWLNNDSLKNNTPLAAGKDRGMIRGDHYYQIVCIARGADGVPVLLASAQREKETKKWVYERTAVDLPVNYFRIFGDKTVNVVDMNYKNATGGYTQTWSINSNIDETQQHTRAMVESKSRIFLTHNNQAVYPQGLPDFPYGDDRGWLDYCDNYFYKDETAATPMFEYWKSGTYGGEVKIKSKSLGLLQNDINKEIVAESVGGGLGTYFAVSYRVRILGRGMLVGMDLDSEIQEETRDLRCLSSSLGADSTLNIFITRAQGLDVSTPALVSGVMWLAATVACPPAAGAEIAVLFNVAASSAAAYSAFYSMPAGDATVSAEFRYEKYVAQPGGCTRPLPFAIPQWHEVNGQGSWNVHLNQHALVLSLGSTHTVYTNINLSCKLKPKFASEMSCKAEATLYALEGCELQ